MATIDFTNNTRNADGRVNCVSYFNAGGDSFFNISEIELKLKELNEFLLNAISIESKEKIQEHIEAAKSIKSKLQENYLRNENFFIGGLTDVQIDFYYNRLTQ